MENTTYDNHPSLYLLDGNIVLVAPRSTHDFVAFRVHRSLLAKVSTVFESMFTIPNGDNVEKYDGAPLVVMNDGAEQLEMLLRMMYHEMYVVRMMTVPAVLISLESDLPLPLDPCTPESVKPILLLANKYAMDNLRRRIVNRVEQDWPVTLQLWDSLEYQINLAKRRAGYSLKDADFHHSYLDDHLPEPASAIRLARECDIPTILPAAFYHLSRLSVFDNGNGAYQHDDGHRTAEWGLLSAQDLICLMKGQRRLDVAVQEILSHLPGCHNDCVQLRFELLQEIRAACQHSYDILHVTRSYVERFSYGDKLCYICCSHVRCALDRFRQDLWTDLPNLFCL
jgi:hypothetical protein